MCIKNKTLKSNNKIYDSRKLIKKDYILLMNPNSKLQMRSFSS